MSIIIEPDECDCTCHRDPVNEPVIHNVACCDGFCDQCGKYIQRGMMGEHVRTKHPSPQPTEEEQRNAHVRRLADSRCRNKHRDYYDSLVCIGPGSAHFGPPCNDCIEETRKELEMKRCKAHGVQLSPEEAAEVRKRLGFE